MLAGKLPEVIHSQNCMSAISGPPGPQEQQEGGLLPVALRERSHSWELTSWRTRPRRQVAGGRIEVCGVHAGWGTLILEVPLRPGASVSALRSPVFSAACRGSVPKSGDPGRGPDAQSVKLLRYVVLKEWGRNHTFLLLFSMLPRSSGTRVNSPRRHWRKGGSVVEVSSLPRRLRECRGCNVGHFAKKFAGAHAVLEK